MILSEELNLQNDISLGRELNIDLTILIANKRQALYS